MILELFFYSNAIFHMEIILEGASINKIRYKEILGLLRDSIRLNRPEFSRRKY